MTLLLIITLPGFALDITLNGQNHIVVDDSILSTHARWKDGRQVLPLSVLYPWLLSVDYLEARSGENRVYWDSSRLEETTWDNVLLVKNAGMWEIRLNRDVFSNPDRIAVRGVRRNATDIRIWSNLEEPQLESDLRGALALRDVDLHWTHVNQLGYLLDDPPVEGRPHLVLLDDLSLISSLDQLSAHRSIAGRGSRWFSRTPEKEFALPLALDAKHPDAALPWLLHDHPDLFSNTEGLRLSLERVFRMAVAAKGTELIVTEKPIASLTSGIAALAVQLPSSREPAPELLPIPPFEGLVNLLRRHFVAIPLGLSADGGEVAALAMVDMLRWARDADAPDAVHLPIDNRTLRYYDAYRRIGRLALSEQLSPDRAARLIVDFINEE